MIVSTKNVIQITLTLNEAEIFARALDCAVCNNKDERRDYNDNELSMIKELAYEVRKAT